MSKIKLEQTLWPAGTLGWFRFFTKDAPDDTQLFASGVGGEADVIQVELQPQIGALTQDTILIMDGTLPTKNRDFRILAQREDFRVVAPNAKKSGRRVYLNGNVVVERRSKDSLGNEIWVEVDTELVQGSPIFTLLVGDAVMYEEPF